jgi:hypothetical protein
MTPFFGKLAKPAIWERILRERLSEPLHLNALSVLVALFGGFESKVYFDLVIRPHNAFCLLQAARAAKKSGYSAFTAIEFGVANGAGLLNMAEIAAQVTKATGTAIELVGFDAGGGMPPPLDYRDHPDCYGAGDFPMQDYDALRKKLPPSARLIIGNVTKTVPEFVSSLRPDCPLGYVVMDVDYYSSTVDCLKIFSGDPQVYLPDVLMYLDDITYPQHNPWQGEYLAIAEFNQQNAMRKVSPYNFLRAFRLFKKSLWIDQVFLVHVLDHAQKSRPREGERVILGNPYMNLPTVG